MNKNLPDLGECGLPRINTGKHDPFLAACARHDQIYLMGGSFQNHLKADKDFWADMGMLIRFRVGWNWWKSITGWKLQAKRLTYATIASSVGRFIWQKATRLPWGKE
jgi:hypothetical protein